tara:strand:- start:163 stop:1422 length:1260 start_codon:yes stop_codon:yes gene_type:complete
MNQLRKNIALFSFFLVSGCSLIPNSNLIHKFDSEISESDIKNHIKFLSSDELEGRFPGSKGSKLAINYIVDRFEESNLDPLNDDSFLQYFEFTNLKKDAFRVANVIGYIPGSKYKNEFIVIGAHFDHLGFGGPHSGSLEMNSNEIHNGADDNASGVAGMLELASKLSQNRKKLNRSIVFVGFNAEEQGILGSKYFVENFFKSKDNIITMINMDMIGRMKNLSLNISGTGTSPIFDKLLDKIAANNLINIKKSPGGYGPSDHSSFYSNDIPVLFFFTGAHSDYHKPSDDWNKINYNGQKKILNMIHDTIIQIDTNEERPAFTEAGPKSMASTGSVRLNVTFGFMPSYASSDKGLGVDGVRSGGPADEAGIQKGDFIVEINGKSVEDIYSYMEILQALKKGETSQVKVLRNNKGITLNINH